jgi:hypothetical protein
VLLKNPVLQVIHIPLASQVLQLAGQALIHAPEERLWPEIHRVQSVAEVHVVHLLGHAVHMLPLR